jgi:hypothetical protein
MPNIWAINNNDDDSDDGKEDHEVVAGNLEDDLEKPSFLRRLGRRRTKEEAHDHDEADKPAANDKADDKPGKSEEAEKDGKKDDGDQDEKDKA